MNKAHIFRVWRENVLSIHLQRNRAQSALYVFRKYNQMHKKYIFTRWYKFTQHQKYKRGLFTHVFGNHLRRKLFLSFHFWYRRKMQSEYEVLCNTTRHAVAVSLRRQLQSRRLRSIIKMWRVRVSRDVHKRRTILGLLKWKHYHNITTAWRKLNRNSASILRRRTIHKAKLGVAVAHNTILENKIPEKCFVHGNA